MIIKSMTRKNSSFDQLIDYLDREGVREEYHVFQNLYERKMDEVRGEFEQNAKMLPKRKNGVILYHEVLSIVKNDELPVAEQKDALREIAELYLKNRAPENIALGVMHDDAADNLHYHFVISANGYKTRKRTRLSKAQFARVQKELEAHVLEHYPQLKQKVAINKKAERKLSKKGAELKRRSGRMPKREQMIGRLNSLFQATSRPEAVSLMSRENVEFYQRGKNIGVIDLQTGKRHRLKTLGALGDYQSFVERVELTRPNAQVSNAQKRQKVRKTDAQTQSVSDAQRSPLENGQRNTFEQSTPEREIEEGQSELEKIQNERREQMKDFRAGRTDENAQTRKR